MLAALVGPLRADADRLLARWRESDVPIGAGRAALRGAALAYRKHGFVLRALAVASEQDPEATTRALVAMNVTSLLTLRPDTSDAEVDQLVATLSTIWERTIFRD